jgi:hypothetical protein
MVDFHLNCGERIVFYILVILLTTLLRYALEAGLDDECKYHCGLEISTDKAGGNLNMYCCLAKQHYIVTL